MSRNDPPELLADETVALVEHWLRRAEDLETPTDRRTADQLRSVVSDDDGVAFVMRFVDRVVRPDDDRVAADQLSAVVAEHELPGFLSSVDRALLRAGARLGPALPSVVMPLARRRMRAIVGHLVAPAETEPLDRHLERLRSDGFATNVNLLGEAVLGEREANRRLEQLLALIDQPEVDYVSVKISAVASQLNLWAHDDSLRRITERFRRLVERAASASPVTFVNVDMEEYHDLHLTLDAFMAVLGDAAYRHVDAGIVLQAYLPDSWPALQTLVEWANERHASGGGTVKIRLVKGANLAMEQVDAAMHGWEQAPYATKLDTDANYKRCLDWLLHPDHMAGVRLGLASHNLFDVAWTQLLATERGVADRVQFEMLQGMAPAQSAAVRETTGSEPPMLLYTPAVRDDDFDVAIGYLFRRLEENASADNFLRHLFDLRPGSAEFAEQESIFRQALARRHEVEGEPRRRQDRSDPPSAPFDEGATFVNEPDTDPTLTSNRAWIDDVVRATVEPPSVGVITDAGVVDAAIERARRAGGEWHATGGAARRTILHAAANELAKRRGDLIGVMMHEGRKTFAEADVEISEAIDFARWYGERAIELDRHAGVEFDPLGVVAVVPPWNFPVAIPAGGVLAALAAGNAAIFKPAPETPRCAEIVAEACWAAGVPREVLHFLRLPDDHVGQRLILGADAVILTGSSETAQLFRSWKPDLRLFAETSGKNALIITPSADIDLAVADLVRSAFGHSGQKCSAASLAILVGDVYDSPRFRRQLVDAVESIELGPTTRLETTMGPLITDDPNERLARAFTELDRGERWLVEPRSMGEGLWSPGVRDGVTPDSWFARTECFGPVLGLMRADDLGEAIAIANRSPLGLTGGIHSLDPGELDEWTERIEVGNAYVNRHITGAIVRRQPFGGWKGSNVGPGAKAGGINYVAQLGDWRVQTDDGTDDYTEVWASHFAVEHDETGLFCESNVFRYRPLPAIGVRIGADATDLEIERVRKAAAIAGVRLLESHHSVEPSAAFAERLPRLGVERVRMLGEVPASAIHGAANASGTHLVVAPVTGHGRIELLHYVREQAVSRTLHRFGNLVDA